MRFLRGLAALLALVVGLAGIPTALILLAGNPLPADLSWTWATDALFTPDDGTVLVGLIGLIGWISWLLFAISVIAELITVVSGFRIRIRVPGLVGPQRLVAGLLLAVMAMLAVPQAVQAGPTTTPTAGSQSLHDEGPPADSESPPAVRLVNPTRVAGGLQPAAHGGLPEGKVLTHVVERGDDLWSLAEHYYGQGRDWRKIASANPELLSGGPDRLSIGWRLTIPDADVAEHAKSMATVTVRSGDSLSSIAEDVYGQESKWTDIFAANRSQISDPDEVEVGTRLILPSDLAGQQDKPDQTKPADAQVDPEKTPRPDSEHQGHHDSSSAAPRPERNADRSWPGDLPPPPAPEPTAPEPPATRSAAPVPPAPEPLPETMAPEPGGPELTAVPGPQPTREHPQIEATANAENLDVALGVASAGGLLAAAVLGVLASRRRLQLHARPLGRRILHAPSAAQTVETALGHKQQPLNLRTLDLAMRALAAHCHQASVAVPSLALAKVGRDSIELIMTELAMEAPVGFKVAGRTWLLEHDGAQYLESIPGVGEAPRPYPALVSIGSDDQGNQVLVDLESMGLLSLNAVEPALSEAILAAMAVELSFSLWADEMILTLVGSCPGLPAALGKHNVSQTDNLDEVLDRLEQRAMVQRAHQPHPILGQHRVDPDLADPWAPEIVLINQRLTAVQEHRLVDVLTSQPRVTTAAVVAGPVTGSPWCLELGRGAPTRGESGLTSARIGDAVLHPLGMVVVPQLVEPEAQQALVQLVTVTGSEETVPAPWWSHGGDPPPDPPPDNVTYLGKRFGGWGSEGSDQEPDQESAYAGSSKKGSGTVAQEMGGAGGGEVHHPILRLLGPIELAGATGTLPPRAGKQCLEYCGWLLEHPGTTAQTMAAALIVAEGTRRSNMSRLRAWLGVDAQGHPYLPDAYTGRIVLHPSVSSDWQRLQILTAAGVNRTSTGGLRAALELVRGAPLADAAPGQWHWAEGLRTDMISVIRDIGVEVASRALDDNDIDLARWAASRALAAAPGDELLMAARIRTEHQAGNTGETERLTLQLAAQARSLGVDLETETVILLQEVMEGRVRARLA